MGRISWMNPSPEDKSWWSQLAKDSRRECPVYWRIYDAIIDRYPKHITRRKQRSEYLRVLNKIHTQLDN